MSESQRVHGNLADPDYEPTDEELEELSRSAFAHVPEARRQADEKLKAEIARLRTEALARLREPLTPVTHAPR